MCITEDKLVESYGKATTRERFRLIYKNYSIFPQLVDCYETGLFNRILFEAEFLPGYWDYYKELKRNPNIDILILGQHMYAIGEDKYSFSFS